MRTASRCLIAAACPDVGVVGYTLGGGLGLLSREYGLAADHVTAIEVVTADARLRRVTADTEPNLFWALRGGRDNFGIVTALEFRLFPVTKLYGGGLYFGTESLPDVLHAWRDWTTGTTGLPREMTSSLAMIPMPDLPAVPEPLRGEHVTQIRIAYLGDPAEGERLVAPAAGIAGIRSAHGKLLDALSPWSTGKFLNFVLGEHTPDEQVSKMYSPADLHRLRQIKADVDPENRFRLTHNITPARDAG